jgi:TonB family protein
MVRRYLLTVSLVLTTCSAFAAERAFDAALELVPSDLTLVAGVVGADRATPERVGELLSRLPLSAGSRAVQLLEPKKLAVAIGSEAVMAVRLQDATALLTGGRSKARFDVWLVFQPRDPALVWEQIAAAAAPGISAVRTASGLELHGAGPENELLGCLAIVDRRAVLSSPCDNGARPKTRDGKTAAFADSIALREASADLPWPNQALGVVNLPALYEQLQTASARDAIKQLGGTQVLDDLIEQQAQFASVYAVFASEKNGNRSISSFGPKDNLLGTFLMNSYGGVTSSRSGNIDIAAGDPASKPETNGEPWVLTADITPPSKLNDISPIYPASAKHTLTQGRVVLQLVVCEDGSVTDVKVLRSIEQLDQAAIDCVSQWKYKPAQKDGKPVAVYVTVTVNFQLAEPSSSQN